MGAIDQQISSRSAGVPGLEPRITEPESVVLPITPYPKGFHLSRLAAEAAGSNLHAHPAPTKSSGGDDRHTPIRTSVDSPSLPRNRPLSSLEPPMEHEPVHPITASDSLAAKRNDNDIP